VEVDVPAGSSVPLESHPPVTSASDELNRSEDFIPGTNSVPDTTASSNKVTNLSIAPNAEDADLVSVHETFSNAMPDSHEPLNHVPNSHTNDAISMDSQSMEPITGSQTAEPLPSETAETSDPMSNSDFQTLEPVPSSNTTNSISNSLSTNSIPDSQTANTNNVFTPPVQSSQQHTTTPRRDGPRSAASSSSVTGADPIASSGDLAIDSSDVIIKPEDVEEDTLEIAHLNHDWLDKVRTVFMYICIVYNYHI